MTCSIDGCERPAKARGLCNNCYQRSYRAADPERARAQGRAWYAANRERVLEAQHIARAANRAERRALVRDRRFDLASGQYDAMSAAQADACAICGQPETACDRTGRVKALAVDHDHATGTTRSLLCQGCNTGIGSLGDDSSRLRAAADYLDRHAS